jgi:hypothetical protein
MPCLSTPRAGQSLVQRMSQVEQALKRLEQALQTGSVRVQIAPNGAIAFVGWKAEDRVDVSDVCAYRSLASTNSWALRQAVARAESQQGRKVNAHAVAAGVHSHDGGRTWHGGHK